MANNLITTSLIHPGVCYLTLKQVAPVLDVTPSIFRKMLSQGQLPFTAIKHGGIHYICIHDLVAYLVKSNSVGSLPQQQEFVFSHANH